MNSKSKQCSFELDMMSQDSGYLTLQQRIFSWYWDYPRKTLATNWGRRNQHSWLFQAKFHLINIYGCCLLAALGPHVLAQDEGWRKGNFLKTSVDTRGRNEYHSDESNAICLALNKFWIGLVLKIFVQ